jgi:phosphoglycerate dehydrogenase-like enzyme
VFGLLLGLAREIPEHNRLVHSAQWQRRVGLELHGAVLGVVGLGQVGRAVVQRALVFGMRVLAFNSSWSAEHADFEARLQSGIASGFLGDSTASFQRMKDLDSLLSEADFVSLHVNLNRDTRKIIDARRLRLMKRSALLVNVSRGGLVDHQALARSLREGTIGGYAADVLEVEPVNAEEPLLNLPRVVLTPHIGSRTRTSVQRQGVAALQNLLQVLS